MNTIKTSIVVVLLLAVLYGVYVVLNEPDPQPPPEVAWQDGDATSALQIDLGEPTDPGTYTHPLVSGAPSPEAASGGAFGEVSSGDSSLHAPHDQVTDSPPVSPSSTLGAPEPIEPSDRAFPAAADTHSPSGPLPAYVPPAETDTRKAYQPSSAGPPPTPSKGSAGKKNDAAQHLVVRAFEKAVRSAQSQIEKGQYHDALFTLSIFYDSPDLSEQEQQKLLDLLDPLAGKVIYSRDHCLESPHKVGADETLMDIAQRYNIPWQLLQNINGIRDPKVLVPGTELKVVRGPFRAEVDLAKGELTVFLGRLYAGRFPISLGQDPLPTPGDYQVRGKQLSRPYYGSNGRAIPARDPGNPYGRVWIDLGGDLCIHGSPPSVTRADSRLGCISLSPIDADDVYAILSQGSNVAIRR